MAPFAAWTLLASAIGGVALEPLNVTVGAAQDRISIQAPALEGRSVRVLELRVYQDYPAEEELSSCWEGKVENSGITFPRFDGKRDRLYAKFQLVDKETDAALGPPQWVTDLSRLERRDFALPWPESPKGITCPVMSLENDLEELGVKYVNDNVDLPPMFDWDNPSPEETWQVDGHIIPINRSYIESLDSRFRNLTDLGVNIHVVLNNVVRGLEETDNPLVHPSSEFGPGSMGLGAFNLANEHGFRAYRAAIEYLANRYSQPGGEHGWVAGYIVGNELQAHYAWWNMGRQPAETVIEHYMRALRVTDLAVRQYHPGIRTYISLEHHWSLRGHLNDPLKEIPGKEILERIASLSKAGGDFPWHVAFHPYPENLFEPRFWNDRTAIMNFSTPRITFKNIEVLTAFMHQPAFFYKAKPRRIILSEQGFHTPDSPDGERVQAACYALAYYKVSHMPEIDAFMLHRHVSARNEGGLKLGLWTCSDDPSKPFEPGRKKAIWEVFRLADAPDWREAFAFSLPIIGIERWEKALPNYRISADAPPKPDEGKVVFDFYEKMSQADVVDAADWRPDVMVVAGGWPAPSIFHHPPERGVSTAAYEVPLPPVPKGERLVLRFYTGFSGKTANGAAFAVLVNGRKIWHAIQTEQPPIARTLDLTSWAGTQAEIALQIDALGNTSYDWAHWVHPKVVVEE